MGRCMIHGGKASRLPSGRDSTAFSHYERLDGAFDCVGHSSCESSDSRVVLRHNVHEDSSNDLA